MTITEIVIAILVLVLVLWAISALVPLDPTAKQVAYFVVVVLFILWVLRGAGFLA